MNSTDVKPGDYISWINDLKQTEYGTVLESSHGGDEAVRHCRCILTDSIIVRADHPRTIPWVNFAEYYADVTHLAILPPEKEIRLIK